jgi:Domain of unknown function (DUF4407)
VSADLDGQVPPQQAGATMPMKKVPASALPGAYRPVLPDLGPGRWFRACAGIKEDVMDWSPAERAKYTGLGIIVLNTGCLAAFAMFTALGKIVAVPPVALIPFALIWGWIIFSVDRWLIASTHGVRGLLSRAVIFLPRLLLAILLAFTIAEPLTLRIFQNTLDSTALTTRTRELYAYQSRLQTCNPVSGQWVGSTACDGYHLSVANSPYAIQQKLATAKQQQTQLEGVIGAEEARHQNLTTIAQGECAGTAGAGMSGSAGEGARCKADWKAASAYAKQSGLAGKQAQLSKLQATITTLIQQTGAAGVTYGGELHQAITTAVDTRRKEQAKQIGIIEEWDALELLSSQSTFVFFGHWLLVLVMMALDCLPVLAKLMSEASTYDELISEERASDERIHATDLRFREETATVDKEVEIYLAEMRKRDRKRGLDQEERVRNAQGDTDGLDDVRALAAKWLRDAEA